jgi:hypothetical protein
VPRWSLQVFRQGRESSQSRRETLLAAAPPSPMGVLSFDRLIAASYYRAFLLIDRNRIFSRIAFCATALGVRRSFFAVCDPDSFAFANARRFSTSSSDHANINRFLRFAIDTPLTKHIIPTRSPYAFTEQGMPMLSHSSMSPGRLLREAFTISCRSFRRYLSIA